MEAPLHFAGGARVTFPWPGSVPRTRASYPSRHPYTGRVEVTLAGGLVVDVATKGDLQHHHERIEKILGERKDVRAYRISGSGATTAGYAGGAGPIAISFTPMSPPAGRIWLVKWVTVWVGTTVAAGTTNNLNCAVMVGRCPTGPGAPIQAAIVPIISDVVIPTQTVPPPAGGVPSVLEVKSEQQLYVLLAGDALAVSTVYNCAAIVVDAPDVPGAILW
jgi:hypothetical protein